MSGALVRVARKAKGLNQQELATRLGVSQGYVSLLEGERRPVPPRLAEKLVRLLDLPATELPVRSDTPLDDGSAPRVLGALGHEGFGYLRPARRLNPTEVLLRTLRMRTVDARVVEGLVWILVKYPQLDWTWLVRLAKQDDLQNRLGFLLAVAGRVAGFCGDRVAAERLSNWEQVLEHSRLQKFDTFSRGGLTAAEERWLRVHGSEEARRWNVLSTLSAGTLSHAAC